MVFFSSSSIFAANVPSINIFVGLGSENKNPLSPEPQTGEINYFTWQTEGRESAAAGVKVDASAIIKNFQTFDPHVRLAREKPLKSKEERYLGNSNGQKSV